MAQGGRGLSPLGVVVLMAFVGGRGGLWGRLLAEFTAVVTHVLRRRHRIWCGCIPGRRQWERQKLSALAERDWA